MASTSPKPGPSRFPALKSFKLPSPPPPPPPKDFSYPRQNNSSLVSLSPKLYAGPDTPHSPRDSSFSPPSTSLTSASSFESYSSIIKKSIVRLAKRPLSKKSSKDATDDGISRPWNFKHNIHVDETYNGLPTTWSAALAERGFSQEEIESIHQRRAASRSSSIHPYQLSKSPSTSSHSMLTTSGPHSSILRRETSEASVSSRRSQYPPRKSSETSSYHSAPSSGELDDPQLPSSAPIHIHGLSRPPGNPRSKSHPSSSFEVLPDSTTPPRRILNGASLSDYYRSPGRKQNGAHHHDLLSSSRLSQEPSRNDASTSDSHLFNISTKRMSHGLPRLSLGKDAFADLSQWTESLFSSPTGASSGVESSSPLKSTDAWTAPSFTSSDSPHMHKPSSGLSNITTIHEPPMTIRSIVVPPTPQPSTESGEGASPDSPISEPSELDKDTLNVNDKVNKGRDNRDSNMSTATVTNATIVRGVEVAKWARASVMPTLSSKKGDDGTCLALGPQTGSTPRQSSVTDTQVEDEESQIIVTRSPSPESSLNSHVSRTSSSSSPTGPSSSASSGPRPHATTVVIREVEDEDEQQPDSDHPSLSLSQSKVIEHAKINDPEVSFVDFDDDDNESLPLPSLSPPVPRPSIQLMGFAGLDSAGAASAVGHLLSPWSQQILDSSPTQRYRGWLAEILVPLEEFIDDKTDPRNYYDDLKEIAEGESGYVYSARVTRPLATLPSGGDGELSAGASVAIKAVPILPQGCPKLDELKRELNIMKGVKHSHVLTMDRLFVDLVEDSLWIKMELMERSLADVLELVQEGITIPEKVIARFANDVANALNYLQKMGIAHRDLRSDNMLINKDGLLKLADFSNAVKVTPGSRLCSDIVGAVYWQAPEVRSGSSYDPLKADVWSFGATVWEMAQAEPPFNNAKHSKDLGDRWPALRQAQTYSRSFHDFLHLCSNPVPTRPDPDALLTTAFIRNVSKRSAVVQLLARCKSIEEDIRLQESSDF